MKNTHDSIHFLLGKPTKSKNTSNNIKLNSIELIHVNPTGKMKAH